MHYTRREPKLNVIVVVESGNHNTHTNTSGSTNQPRRWVYITQENVDQFIFSEFIDSILNNIGSHLIPDGYNDKRCIMWNNLSLHKTDYFTNKIRDCPTPNDFFTVD